MAKMVQVSFQIDEELKISAEKVLHELGLSLSEAITIFLETVVREQRIPFEITPDPFYSEGNLRCL